MMTSRKNCGKVQSYKTDTVGSQHTIRLHLLIFSSFYTVQSYRLWDRIYPTMLFFMINNGKSLSYVYTIDFWDLKEHCIYLHSIFSCFLSLFNLNLISSKSLSSLVDHFYWYINMLESIQQVSILKYILKVNNKSKNIFSFNVIPHSSSY